MSASGQTRKIRTCPLHVRFTPLSGRMLRQVLNFYVGPEAGRRDRAPTKSALHLEAGMLRQFTLGPTRARCRRPGKH